MHRFDSNICVWVSFFSSSVGNIGVTKTLRYLQIFLNHWRYLSHCKDKRVLKGAIIFCLILGSTGAGQLCMEVHPFQTHVPCSLVQLLHTLTTCSLRTHGFGSIMICYKSKRPGATKFEYIELFMFVMPRLLGVPDAD